MKSFYRHILVWAVAILSLWEVSSCDNSLSRIPELAKAENCMEAHPDSALAILQAVDTLQLTTEAQKAKYALLLSMALDKNVIDRTDFDVLQPAIDYYADHGTATDQLRTYYYQGRIYSNAGNNPDALKAFMKATDKVEDSDDTMTKARLYFAQIDIYMALLKFDKAEEVCQIAAEYFREAGRSKSYTILEALIAAGDLLPSGKRKNIKVIREEAGVRNNYYIDLTDNANVMNSPVYYLKQNDVIYVEPNKTIGIKGSSTLQTITVFGGIASLILSLTSIIISVSN